MPLQATSGAASYDAFGGGVVAEPNYIESCFSTYLYTGTGANQTITNGIDLSTKGGLIWIKDRVASGLGVDDHYLQDTARGVRNPLFSNLTNAQLSNGDLVTSVSTTGFVDAFGWPSNNKLVSWTFRKQPKFFDVVTWTGTDNNARNISHNLGSSPGCIMVKTTSSTSNWFTYHRSLGYGPTYPNFLYLNTTGSVNSGSGGFFAGNPTSTYFPVGGDFNLTGVTYVAYLFAHNAGGFGLTGTDNVISCGSYVGNQPSTVTVTLGYEPQWLLIKKTTSSQDWIIFDTMRGLPVGGSQATLQPNNTDAENLNAFTGIALTATGFNLTLNDTTLNELGSTYIYIAIRRGPMKVPTSGTSVFKPAIAESDGQTALIGFPPDAVIFKSWGGGSNIATTRLEGNRSYLVTNSTAAASTSAQWVAYDLQNSFYEYLTADTNQIFWAFRRAPSFFDEVCYTGNGVNSRMVTHNLGVQPELLIIKRRDASLAWSVAGKIVGGFKIDAFLNTTAAFASGSPLDLSAEITSTAFQPQVVGNYARALNTSGGTYVAYLFATCAGVSKVSSYTGTGTTQQVNCGFTAGARFVLIKRTDDTSDWYVWDTARGIVSGNDPYLLLNSTAAETTTTDYIDTYSAGFELSSTAPSAINASGGTFIFLAIA